MKPNLFFVIIALLLIGPIHVSAKVWRINNNAGVQADFTSPAAAINSPLVLNDDTLHIEGSAANYGNITLNKRVVIIGTGYFLSGAGSNAGLQADPNPASLGFAYFDSTGSGSTLIGISSITLLSNPTGGAADNITISRCYVYIGINNPPAAGAKMTGWVLNKCYVTGINLGGFVTENWQVTNNIFAADLALNNVANNNNLIRNNVFRAGIYLTQAYFSNNIITNAGFTTTNTTVKNNISIGNNLPAGNGNLNGQTDANLFVGASGNSTDGQWKLKAGSPAIGAGETIATITPDCGAYGTADPYRLSGIPPIPTIYSLTVPATVATAATTMPITISTKSNN